jgi:hypothetical protein
MKKILNDLFTGIDGKTHDISRWLWILGILAFISFAGFEVYKSGHFDLVNFGMAYSTLLAGGAFGVKVKESQEPPKEDSNS